MQISAISGWEIKFQMYVIQVLIRIDVNGNSTFLKEFERFMVSWIFITLQLHKSCFIVNGSKIQVGTFQKVQKLHNYTHSSEFCIYSTLRDGWNLFQILIDFYNFQYSERYVERRLNYSYTKSMHSHG